MPLAYLLGMYLSIVDIMEGMYIVVVMVGVGVVNLLLEWPRHL